MIWHQQSKERFGGDRPNEPAAGKLVRHQQACPRPGCPAWDIVAIALSNLAFELVVRVRVEVMIMQKRHDDFSNTRL
jgi:hypothetical protein